MIDVCPECDGSGRFYIPSDGYESSKSGPCHYCRGRKTFESYIIYQKNVIYHNLDSNERDLEILKKIIKKQKKIIKQIRDFEEKNGKVNCAIGCGCYKGCGEDEE